MSSRIWLGIFFLAFGVGLLMHQANMINFSEVLSTWWPLILIFIGIIQLINRTYSSVISGLLFLLVGVLFLLNQLFNLNLIAYLWPLIFIFIGIVIIFSRITREKTSHMSSDLNTFAIFSGADIKSQSKNFQGGSVTALFGRAEIDLREAAIPEEGAAIDLTAAFGGISITVPEHVHLEFSGLPLFGGWEDKTRIRGDNDRSVVVKLNCLTFCGGVEVKN